MVSLAVGLAVSQPTIAQQTKYDPMPDPAAVVLAGSARFTVLTPGLVRLEYSPSNQFEDRASFAFVQRKLAVPAYQQSVKDGWLEIKTALLTLRYRSDSGPFGPDNLSIEMSEPAVRWKPGLENTGDLGGTWRTLDGVSGMSDLEPGLLSRAGWTLVDDSARLLFDNGDWPWAVARDKTGNTDWYFFAYGKNYVGALQDFVKVAGQIPLPPRYVFGAWWSRYWAYSDAELRKLVSEFQEHEVPLDVLVVDMDWHLDGWTGYTWNPKYFPDPQGFLKWTGEQGLKVPLNLHPADGVGKHETMFEEFARAMELDPKKVDRVPFDCTNRAFVENYFKLLHHPYERMGIDFWWMDWQQGKDSKVAGLDPLFWLNYLHWTDWERNPGAKPNRPLVFSRWGGLGNHRYQIGFSGDTFCDWASLAFQPQFTATAGNVGYGYWSHDIGGHQPGPVDPELYARWIQWGVFSPVIRTHTTKNPKAERRIWEFPDEVYAAAKSAWVLRYHLIPYIYTMARRTHDTTLPLCRPLYYHWPELEEAYNHPGEYLFGDDFLLAPVTQPVSPKNRCASITVWLPPGQWTHWFSGRTYTGPGEIRQVVPLEEIPLFARAGAIIPGAPKMRFSEEKPLDPLTLHVFPAESGSTRVYEDEGVTRGYLHGEFAHTPVSSKRTPDGLTVAIGPVEGAYPGKLKQRGYEIRLRESLPPTQVRVDGEPLAKLNDGAAAGWTYDPASLSAVILTGPRATSAGTVVAVEFAKSPELAALIENGLHDLGNILRTMLARHADLAPAAARETLSAIEAILNAPQDAGKSAEALRGAGLRLAGELGKSQVPEPFKTEYITRLMGLFAKLDIRGADDGGQKLTAFVQLSLDPLMGSTSRIRKQLAFEPPDNWIHGDPDRKSSKDAAGNDVMTVSTSLQPQGSLQTAVLKAEAHVSADGVDLVLPLEQVLLPSINAWWILGPLDADAGKTLDDRISKLERVDPEEKFDGKGELQVRWKPFVRPVQPGLDLAQEFFVHFTTVFGQRHFEAAAYAVVFLDSPREMDVRLAMGSDDGAVVWLNGHEIHRVGVGRAYASKQDKIKAKLRAGSNTLVLRIDQQGGDWGFGVHVETPDGHAIPEITADLQPQRGDE